MFDIPTVLSADELLDKAFRRAARSTGRGRTRSERTRSAGIAKVTAVGDTVADTLERYVRSVPSLERLHPFYRELVDLLCGIDALRKHLGAIDWCRKRVRALARNSVRSIGRAESIAEISARRQEAFGRIGSLVHQVSRDLDAIAEARNRLRRFPGIDPELPTIVVAGSPNVGKSEFVRAVSTARPKVAEYPFTTKEVSVGFFERGYRRYQVIDTPGLLDRPMEQRNPIEKQAVNALRHLADAVVFLFDPSGTCGYPLEEQERLFASVQESLPNLPLIPVDNKADFDLPPTGRRRISALHGSGVPALIDEVLSVLTSRAPGAGPREQAG